MRRAARGFSNTLASVSATEVDQRGQSLRAQLKQLRAGLLAPSVMAELAGIWTGRHPLAMGRTPGERFKHYCGPHRPVVNAVRAGLQAFIQRDDLPDAQELTALAADGLSHIVRDACLLGAELTWAKQPTLFELMSERALARLIALQLSEIYPRPPEWFTHLARSRPTLVASALVTYAEARFRAGYADTVYLQLLDQDPAFETVSRLAVPRLLKAFPARIKSSQLQPLRLLLLTALRRQMPELRSIVAQKTQRKSVATAQRVLWLLAGTLQHPASFEDSLWRFAEQSWQRQQQIAAFVSEPLSALPLAVRPDSRTGLKLQKLGLNLVNEEPPGNPQKTTRNHRLSRRFKA